MKIICIGRNYSEHIKELNNTVPDEPVIFLKPQSAVLYSDNDFYYPEFTKDLHYECEVVVKICKNGKHIQEKFAKNYYEELTLGIDFTARDKQNELKQKGLPWELAKAFDKSAVIGTFTTKQSFADVQHIPFRLLKNGVVVQDGNTKNMLYTIDQMIVFVSQYFSLNKGDLLFTGTPAGVGPVQTGDTLEGILQGNSVLHLAIK